MIRLRGAPRGISDGRLDPDLSFWIDPDTRLWLDLAFTRATDTRAFPIEVRESPDLVSWNPAAAPFATAILDPDVHGDGVFERIRYRWQPDPDTSQAFYRLHVKQ